MAIHYFLHKNECQKKCLLPDPADLGVLHLGLLVAVPCVAGLPLMLVSAVFRVDEETAGLFPVTETRPAQFKRWYGIETTIVCTTRHTALD